MDIAKTLLADQYQSKIRATEVAQYACISQENFDELVQAFLANEYRLAQRAAYSLGMAARERPELIGPHIGRLIEQLNRTDVHDAVVRNSARILEDIEIPEQYHGELIDIAFQIIQNNERAIAIRAFSLTILDNLARIYPEIRNELRIVIQERMDYETPAFVSRGRKILARRT